MPLTRCIQVHSESMLGLPTPGGGGGRGATMHDMCNACTFVAGTHSVYPYYPASTKKCTKMHVILVIIAFSRGSVICR